MHHLLSSGSILCLLVLLFIFILKRFNQPYLVGYIIAGILLGPHISGLFQDVASITGLGELGIVFLMFFLGMEVEVPDNRSLLLRPVVAQGMKILLSFVFVLVIGYLQEWAGGTIFVVTTLLIFNSTAVVSEYLRNQGMLHDNMGKTVLNMLLLQDVLLAPILTAFQIMNGQAPDGKKMAAAIVVSIVVFLLLRAIRKRNMYQLPVVRALEKDHDLQVFLGLFFCIGFARIAEEAGLTSALGSFAAGLFIGSTKAFRWLEQTLRPFKVFFVALFFVSVGLSLDLDYLKQHMQLILMLTVAVMLINSLLSALVFRLLRYRWPESFNAGGLLSQTGEFGILACSVAFGLGIISENIFKTGVAVTCLSLLFSTVWMSVLRRWLGP